MKGKCFFLLVMLLALILFAGCAGGAMGRYIRSYPIREADWIRDGKPIIYEGLNWHPTENIENHLDKEMEYVGEFQRVPFYVERRQIKPYNRIYTKFGYHKYRVFLEKKNDHRD